MNNILERFKQVPARLLEIWKKYTKKQKVTMISAVASVIIALVILILVLGKTTYTELYKFKGTEQAAQAIDLLKEAGIAYDLKSDNATVMVDVKKLTDATLLVASSNISDDEGFSIADLLNTSMSTTNSDKKLMLDLFTQSQLESALKKLEGIDDAMVQYYPKDTTYSILEGAKDIGCTVILTTNSNFKDSMAEKIAIIVAAGLGNANADLIKVMDHKANLLYNGPVDEKEVFATKRIEYQTAWNNLISEQVTRFGLANLFTTVDVSPNVLVNMDEESVVYKEYTAADGLEQGLFSTLKTIASENASGDGGPVGTDSNDENDYYVQTGNSGTDSYESMEATYTPNEKLTTIMKAPGALLTDECSMGVTLRRVKTITEKELEIQGLLEGTTFDEYIVNNSEPAIITLSDELIKGFSDCSGIPLDNLTITAYETYVYVPKTATATNWDLYLKIILAVLIVGMLIFVVFRGMAPVEVTELEPELSVEQLLATTKENQSLDDIEFSEKSETRRMIEKFVEENPEAVANLLRSWLEEGWD